MQTSWYKVLQSKKWFILAGVAMIIAAVIFGLPMYQEKTKPAVTGKIIQVERGDIVSVVSATGTITPVNLVNVSSKITGLIEKVYIDENNQVKTGQVLMTLDDTHLKALVNQAQARLANVSANFQRMQRLNAIGAVSDQQLDAARMDYNVAQAAYDDAVSQLSDTVIRAPIDGVVIGKPIPAGQTVSPGISTPMVLLTVADMSKMQIDAQVDESDIGKVAVGQKVNFTVDAYPGKTFTGVVSNISQRATLQQNVVYYSVTIDVVSHGDLLKPTMTARISINIGERKNTLLVPLSAIKQSKGQQYIQVMRDGQTQNVAVTTGLAGDDRIEIVSGLNDGDEVFLPQTKPQNAGAQKTQNTNPGSMLRGVVR